MRSRAGVLATYNAPMIPLNHVVWSWSRGQEHGRGTFQGRAGFWFVSPRGLSLDQASAGMYLTPLSFLKNRLVSNGITPLKRVSPESDPILKPSSSISLSLTLSLQST